MRQLRKGRAEGVRKGHVRMVFRGLLAASLMVLAYGGGMVLGTRTADYESVYERQIDREIRRLKSSSESLLVKNELFLMYGE